MGDEQVHIYETADTFDLPDQRVWVSGDWHGNAQWIQALLPAMRRRDASLRTILQLGDYGFSHDGNGARPIDYWAKRAGIERVLVTLGNHEDWRPIGTAHEGHVPRQAIRVSDVVWLLPRPFRFRIGGRDVLSLGGASSVDKHLRTPGRDWFDAELITDEMEAAAVAEGREDLFLTHESPTLAVPEVRAILDRNVHGIPGEARAISAAQRERVQRVQDATQPELHMHGHMHVYGELDLQEGRRVISLAHDNAEGNAGVLHMATLGFEPLPLIYIRRRSRLTNR